MNDKERAAMQQALDAMEECLFDAKWYKAKIALREALAEQACPNGCDTSNGRCVDCPDYVAEQAEQEPVAWHHPQCDGQCIACLIEKAVQDAYGTQGRDYMLRHINAAAPVRTKDLTDDEIREMFNGYVAPETLLMFRAVIAKFKEKNNANNNT